MNEYNHHRIIDRFSSGRLSDEEQKLLENASDFTDSINAEWKYYFYHFYYDIEIKDNSAVNEGTITLSRVDEDQNVSAQSMRRCGNIDLSQVRPKDKALKEIRIPILIGSHDRETKVGEKIYYNTSLPYDSAFHEKEFFSMINNREKSPKMNAVDIGNQSDNVAFLHAMSSKGETPLLAKGVFKEHLKKCFLEYLFLEDEGLANFMLGIALHGIMDSFTPSHTAFQNYEQQDMAKHAQGDVIPFPGDVLEFVPGQIDKDTFGAKLLDRYIKGFNDDESLNVIEYKMLYIYMSVFDISRGKALEELWESLKGKKRSQINQLLCGYKPGPKAYIYLNRALSTMCRVYVCLHGFRKNIAGDYERYKNESSAIVQEACNIWDDEFTSFLKNEFNVLLINHFKKEFNLIDRLQVLGTNVKNPAKSLAVVAKDLGITAGNTIADTKAAKAVKAAKDAIDDSLIN